MTPAEANADLLARLHVRYPREKSWCIFTEVPNAAWGGSRRADALVLNFSSDREALEGFEFKVTRADWLTEMRQPTKAKEGLQPYVHRWWLVTLKDLVKPEELPDGWGMLLPHGKSFKAAVQARPVADPKPLSPYVSTCLIRRLYDEQRLELERRVSERARELQGEMSEARIQEIEKSARQDAEGEIRMLKDGLEEVQRVLGIRFVPDKGRGQWRRGDIDWAGLDSWEAAPVVRAILGEDRDKQKEYAVQAIERAEESVGRFVTNLQETLTRLELVKSRIGVPTPGEEQQDAEREEAVRGAQVPDV